MATKKETFPQALRKYENSAADEKADKKGARALMNKDNAKRKGAGMVQKPGSK